MAVGSPAFAVVAARWGAPAVRDGKVSKAAGCAVAV